MDFESGVIVKIFKSQYMLNISNKKALGYRLEGGTLAAAR